MSSNGVTIAEDADMAECDGEKVVTMMDVLQEQQEFEEDVNAVLGASDDKNCTFPKGYIKRQALYACLTCCSNARTDSTKRAGVCLACSLNCHEHHELVELYTKRNFRCDCGNPKFNNQPCQYTPDKPDLNEDNSYNQNFSGLYCTCHKPYPDPESTLEDEMIQCIICEDWLHASHLEATLPSNEQYAEMICKSCMDKNEFLHDYSNIAVNSESADVDVTSINNTDGDTLTSDNTSENHNLKVNGALESSETSHDKETKMEIEEDMTETKNDENNVKLSIENGGIETDNGKESAVPDTTDKQKEDVPDTSNGEELEFGKEPTNPDTTNESKVDMPDTSNITKDELEQPCVTENIAFSETTNDIQDVTTASATENNDSNIDSITNDTVCKSTVKDNETNGERSMGDKNATDSEENNIETSSHPIVEKNDVENNKSNESSIIESIENLENELGNVETKGKDEENERTVTKLNDSNDFNKTEDKGGDSITDRTSETVDSNLNDKTENVELKTSDVEIKGENKPVVDIDVDFENETESVKIAEIIGNIQNDSIEDEISKVSDEKDNELEALTWEITKDSKRKLSTEGFDKLAQNDSIEDEISKVSDEKDNELEVKTCEITTDSKRKLSTEDSDELAIKKPKIDVTSSCCRPKGVKRIFKGATFWPSDFRQKLCTCNECISMYKDLSVLFLTDPEDTVTAYEALGKQRINGSASSQYERGMEALSSLDRIQQINALTEYNKMRDKLLDFLKSFKDRKEVVKEEDIKAFFAGMKPKREPDGVYFCR